MRYKYEARDGGSSRKIFPFSPSRLLRMRVFIVVGQPAHFIRADGAVTFYGITFVHVCGHPIHLFLVDPTLFDDGSPIRAQKDYKTLLVAFSSFAHQSANIVVNMRPLIA